MGGVKRHRLFDFRGCKCRRNRLGALSTDAAGQLDVLGHDRHSLGMDCAQVGVLEQTHKVRLRRLLQRQHGRRLEAQVGLVVLRNLTDKALEGQFADEEISALLVLADLTQSDCARAVSVGLLDTLGCGRGLTRSLGGKLLTRSLASGGFTSSLLCSGHLG